jgi:ABC-type glycerol-3-phosphate transport system substrate-binding protein
MTRNRRRLAVLGGVLLVLAGAGVAFAAYLSSGSGNGATTSSVAVSSTISANSSGAQLYPASTSTYTVTINNPNPYPVKVVTISSSSSQATSGGCPAGTVTSPAVTNPAGTIVPNGSGSYPLTAAMAADPDNSCQGQSFVMPLTAQLASAAG